MKPSSKPEATDKPIGSSIPVGEIDSTAHIETGSEFSLKSERRSKAMFLGGRGASVLVTTPESQIGQVLPPRKSVSIAAHPEHAQQAPDNISDRKPRAKSIVMMGNSPVAVLMESEPEVESIPVPQTTVSSMASKLRQSIAHAKLTVHEAEEALHKPPSEQPHAQESHKYTVPKAHEDHPPPEAPKVEEVTKAEDSKAQEPPGKGRRQRGLRTFRIWAPNQDRKSILVKVGEEGDKEEAEKIFETTQIRHKNYAEWHRQARSTLPSVTGGAPIPTVTDIIQIAPTLRKEENPRTMEQTIRRLSLETDEKPSELLLKRKSSVKVDYTKFREIDNSKNVDEGKEEDEEENEEEEEDEDSSDEEEDTNLRKRPTDADTVIEVTESSTDEEVRRLEKERRQAGTDLKEKVKTLRELAEHLSVKRGIRQNLIQKATGLVILDTEQIPLKEHILYMIEATASLLHDAIEHLTIWEKNIREINGCFGVVIASYFVWIRQMVALEIFAFIVTNAIIIIPQMVEDYSDPVYIASKNPVPFSLSDLINGEGSFHHSYLYYTGYKNRNEESENPFHNPAFRFIFCMLLMFFVLTYFIFSRLTKYYQSVRMESKVSGVAHMNHFKSIICGWDYSCRDRQSASYLQKTICRELYILARASEHLPGTAVVIHELQHKKLLAFLVRRFGLFWGPWAIHIFGNLFILFACILLGIILVQLCRLKLLYYVECVELRDKSFNKNLHHNFLCPGGSQYLNTWILSLPALFASMTTLLLTKLIVVVGDSETWNTPERKIYATMIRAGLFNFTNIGVFYTFWISRKPDLKKEGFVAETIFGKELYRLVVIQGVMDVVLNFGVKGIYHLIRRRSKNYQMTEFRTEHCSLSMFFIHSVSRIGTLFCPPLSIFVTLRLILDFYQNRFALLHLSARGSYAAHASQVYAPFLLTFFILCYLITSFMNVFYITETTPSSYNGPFINYTESYDQVLGLLLESEKGISWLRILVQPGFLATFNAILAGLAYFCHQWGRAYEPIIDDLNEHITMERSDRELLLKAIFEIGKVTADKLAPDPKKSKRSAVMAAVNTIQEGDADDEGSDEEAKTKGISVKEESKDTQKDTIFVASDPRAVSPTRSVLSVSSSVVGHSDVDVVEEKVDEQIDQLIHDINRRRLSTLRLSTNQSIQKPSTAFDSREELAKKRKSMAALAEKEMKVRMEHMNAILNNIVKDRRRLMKNTRKSIAKISPSPSTGSGKEKAKPPPTLKAQLNSLSVMKAGTRGNDSGFTTKGKIPPVPTIPVKQQSADKRKPPQRKK